jgi:hypothetical protein
VIQKCEVFINPALFVMCTHNRARRMIPLTDSGFSGKKLNAEAKMKRAIEKQFMYFFLISLIGLFLILVTGLVSCDGLLGGGTGGIEVTISASEGASIASYGIHLEGPRRG